MKILVTGGTGFIGSNLVPALLRNGHEVIVIGNKTEVEIPGVLFLEAHLNGIDYSRLGRLDACVHLAGNNDTIATDRMEMLRANVSAPGELFSRLFEDHGCQRIVYASSASVYGNVNIPFVEEGATNPLSLYAESKLLFDRWARESNLPVLGVRYTNVFGPGERHKGRRASMVFQMMESVRSHRSIRLFKFGEQRRDWVHVDDVVQINLLALESSLTGIVNCGSGHVVDFNFLAEEVMRGLRISRPIEYIDCPLGEKFQNNTVVSLERAKIELGYEPKLSPSAGIAKLCSNI